MLAGERGAAVASSQGMRKTAALLLAAAALALAACSSPPAAPPRPDLMVTCGIRPAASGDALRLVVIISQSPADPSPGPVYLHTVTLLLSSVASGDHYVTEKVGRWVPGSDTDGWGNGITVTYPAPLPGGYVPGCSSGGSWS